MSLKSKLIETLQTNGRIDLNQLQALCSAYPAKISTAEKRLREFREPQHPDYDSKVGVEYKNGYISAYTYAATVAPSPVKTLPMNDKVREWNKQFYKPVEEVKQTINTLF